MTRWRGGVVTLWRGDAVARWRGDAVARWLEYQTLDRENPGSNPLAAVSKLGQFRSPHFASVHAAV